MSGKLIFVQSESDNGLEKMLVALGALGHVEDLMCFVDLGTR